MVWKVECSKGAGHSDGVHLKNINQPLASWPMVRQAWLVGSSSALP